MKHNKLLIALAAFALLVGCKGVKYEDKYIKFSDYDFSFPEEGGTVEFTTTANVQYTVENSEDWVSVEVASTSGETAVLNITAAPNLVQAKRTANVYFKSPGVPTGTLVLTQDPFVPSGVSPEAIEVEHDATSTTFTIKGNKAWTISSNDAGISFSETSGTGDATITATFPANTGKTDVVYNVLVTIAGTAYTVKITSKHEMFYETIADWEFKTENFDYYNEHFKYEDAKVSGAPNPVSNAKGFLNGDDSHYCPALTGTGKIRFWNGSDKTEVNPGGRCKRGMGNSGEPCWYGNWIGDIAYIDATPSATLPAGTILNIWFCLRPNTMGTLKYWLLEIKDGDNWYPVGDVKTASGDVNYNIELVFNNDAAGTEESPKQINTVVNRNYTLTQACSKVEYRMTCVSLMMADGSREATSIGDVSTGKASNPVVRFAGMSSTGGAAMVEHHTWIAIVK